MIINGEQLIGYSNSIWNGAVNCFGSKFSTQDTPW